VTKGCPYESDPHMNEESPAKSVKNKFLERKKAGWVRLSIPGSDDQASNAQAIPSLVLREFATVRRPWKQSFPGIDVFAEYPDPTLGGS
jgi:hypothetical protein